MKYKTRSIILLCIAAVLAGIIAFLNIKAKADNELRVCCLNVGDADAIILTTNKSAVLIDAGIKGCDKDIEQNLRQRGIKKLDCMIISHFDKDHVGGAAGLIKDIAIGAVYQSAFPGDSEEYYKYLKAAGKHDIEPVTVTEDLSLILDGMEITIYPTVKAAEDISDSNNSSLIVRVKYGERVFLFTGDAGQERLQELINTGSEVCDVLKVPHHGRWQELLKPLATLSGARYAVISCSGEDSEISRTVSLFEELGAEVFITGKGSVVIRCDGKNIDIRYS